MKLQPGSPVMFNSPRWFKVLRDMWMFKGRSLLVVLTIAVGVAGVGVIGQLLYVLRHAMENSIKAVQPSQITMFTVPFQDGGITDRLLKLPQVAKAETLSYYQIRVNPSTNAEGQPEASQWQNFELFALPNFIDKQIDRIAPNAVQGADDWMPQSGELLLERLAAQHLGVKRYDSLWIETPDSELHRFQVDGTVRNQGRESATLSGLGSGFVSMETAEEIGLPAGFNMIVLRVQGDGMDENLLESVAASSRELLRDQSIEVLSTWIPEPGKHWASDIVMSMASILQSLGSLVLVASAVLVVNTMLAMMSSQLRQIGVMQVLGATRSSLVGMYLTQALLLGLLALVICLPLGYVAAGAVLSQTNTLLNFEADGYGLSKGVLALQIAIGVGIPLLSAYVPVLKGTSISAREAIGGAGVLYSPGRRYLIDRLVESIRGLPRPFLLSLRNTFRQKGRLLLTLVTLSLGGAVVISVINVHASLNHALEQSMQYANYDVRVRMELPQDAGRLNEIGMKTQGVYKTETWGRIQAHRMHTGGVEGAELTLEALPPDSELIRPRMLEGEWLSPGEDKALVFDSYLLRKHPDLRVGDLIQLKINDKITTWYIKGFARKTVGEPVSFITMEGLERATENADRAALLHLVTKDHGADFQSAAESQVKELLKDEGIKTASTELTTEMRKVQTARMNIVIVFLSTMAVLLSIVSAIGLAGTMSLNVLERTREFGILRSIGASDSSVAGIVVAEGTLLGVLGWMAGCVLSLPATVWMCRSVGISLFQAPLDMVFSWRGIAFWLVAAIVLSALASLAPAWNAARLSVREILAYE
jgi:putative ABC transport system permease protein